MALREETAAARDMAALRTAIAQTAVALGPSQGRLYRLVPPDGLALWDDQGAEVVVGAPGGGHGDSQAARLSYSPADEVLPLELEDGTLWGYWVVTRDHALAARDAIPQLLPLLEQLHRGDTVARLEIMNGSLMAVLTLGEAVASAKGPAEMVEALHRAARRVFDAESTHLALVGLDGSRWYRASDEKAESSPASARDWLKAFPAHRESWRHSDPRARSAAAVVGGAPEAGMVERVGDPAHPYGLLVVSGGPEAFSETDQNLLSRMADFVFASLVRWERSGSGAARALRQPDIFVLLAQEKERLEYIMRSVPVGLLLTDAEGVISLANDVAGRALGLTDVELREKKMFSARQAGRTIQGLIRKTQAEGKTVSTPYEMEGRWFQIQVVPWPGGEQFLVVTQDVHDWHQLNRLKEDLISIISHEVKNPLTAILNATHLLASERTGPLNESQARVAELIQDNSQQMKSLLDDVVRLSRVYHLNVKHEPVPVAPMIQAIHARTSPTLKGKLLGWTESLEEVTVGGEGPMLESLLVNLIGNAIKYTGIGGHVGVKLWADGGWAKLRVMDDGPGVPPEELDRLFTPFFRASNVKEQVAGTGLGLVISRNIVERLGGTLKGVSPITAEDAAFLGQVKHAARGTSFQVELPLVR